MASKNSSTEVWTTEEFRRRVGATASSTGEPWHVVGSRPKKKRKSTAEEEKQYENRLYDQLTAEGFRVMREYKFHPRRQWRSDLYLPEYGIIIEIEGGIWSGGRHTRGAGYKKDVEKYNEVEIAGYMLLRFVTDHVKKDQAMPVIRRAVERILQEQKGETQ